MSLLPFAPSFNLICTPLARLPRQIYADIFKAESALVRNQFISGSHALTVAFFALLRPGDTLLSITGKPYDTMDEVIGLVDNKSSLKSFGIDYLQVDLINNDPCALSCAVTSNKAFKFTDLALSNERVKLRENRDLYGTQVCGSIKNVVAIAAGMFGLGFSESTRAFLITEAMHDIKELLEKLECNPKTIMSFAGIGDLILTCSSPKSRNYRYGLLLGKRKSKEEIEEYLKENTTEGYYTLLSIKGLTKNRKIKMPIINIIYDIAINHKDPDELVDFLINKA